MNKSANFFKNKINVLIPEAISLFHFCICRHVDGSFLKYALVDVSTASQRQRQNAPGSGGEARAFGRRERVGPADFCVEGQRGECPLRRRQGVGAF